MAEELLDLHPNKEEAGKLYCTSLADRNTIGIPRNAIGIPRNAVPFVMLLIYFLRSGLLSKFQSTSP